MVFGRLFGELAVSRAFGGRDFKKPKADNDWLIAVKPSCCYYYYYLAFFGAFGSAVTSSQDPEIQQVKLKPGVDQFLILACDGLWDKLTYQVILVRRPREKYTANRMNMHEFSLFAPLMITSLRKLSTRSRNCVRKTSLPMR